MARAQGIGAAGATASFGSVEEIERALRILEDDVHRRLHIIPDMPAAGPTRANGVEPALVPGEPFFIVPMIETLELVEELERILGMRGVEAVNLGIGDLADVVGFREHAAEVEGDPWRFPPLLELLDNVVSQARQAGVAVWCNVGRGARSFERIGATVRLLEERGVALALLETPETILQYALHDLQTRIYEQP
jgi:hypothetical protein